MPLVSLDKLKYEVNIKALLKFDFEFFLHFSNDADQVKQSVFHLDRLRLNLPIEVLVEDLLHKGVARGVELLKQLFNQVLC